MCIQGTKVKLHRSLTPVANGYELLSSRHDPQAPGDQDPYYFNNSGLDLV